jgi:thiol-disulfide isomerase/thioredoxin/uncharacterized membrane protein YphA (DoxX/SURF4 family)
MEILLLLARLFLALIFGVAGVAKAARPAPTRQTLIEFGVPEKLAEPFAWALPAVEVVVALALLPLASARWGAAAALALLLTFALAVGLNLRRGRTPDCNCFGQLHSKPLSWSVFYRNLLLVGVAAFVVVAGKGHPGLSAFEWIAALSTGELVNLAVGTILMGLIAAAVIYLRRLLNQQATLLERVAAMERLINEDYAEPAPVEREDAAPPREGLPVGAPAPGFRLATLTGTDTSLDDLLAYGKPVLLMFVSPNCPPCKTLLPAVRVWERDYGEHLTIALLSKGTREENQQRVAKYGARHLLLQGEDPVAAVYQANWTPAAVLISRQGRIASQMIYGDDAVRALVNHTITTGAGLAAGDEVPAQIPRLTVGSSLFKVGEPAPRFSLADLDGRLIHTEEFLGRDTLMLFWDPGCRFCQAMAADLMEWEDRPPKGAPRLVIIASGDAKAIQAKGREFKSLVLVDPEFDIGPVFGSNSTPSAILMDSTGQIASSLAIGAGNVLALAGIRKVELPVVASY